MTEEQKKEMISKEFLRILAHAHGYKVVEHGLDHGVDAILCPVTERVEPSGRRRFLDSQFKLDFQIKSTTPASVLDDDDHIRYDLEAKNFNDLVTRRSEYLPLHLVLVVLRDTPPVCIGIDVDQISIFGTAYWYLPEEGAEITENVSTVRIRIPKTNVLGVTFVGDCYQRLGIEL